MENNFDLHNLPDDLELHYIGHLDTGHISETFFDDSKEINDKENNELGRDNDEDQSQNEYKEDECQIYETYDLKRELNDWISDFSANISRDSLCKLQTKNIIQSSCKIENLKKRAILKNQKEKYKCLYCDYENKRSTPVKRHTYVKHPDKESGLTVKQKLSCSICNKRFSDPRHVVNHMNSIHYKIRPYSCTLCEKTFIQKAHLYTHMKYHTS